MCSQLCESVIRARLLQVDLLLKVTSSHICNQLGAGMIEGWALLDGLASPSMWSHHPGGLALFLHLVGSGFPAARE